MFSNETKQAIAEAQNFFCKAISCHRPCHSIHHKCRDIKANRKKYPLLIDSVFNGVGLCEFHHTNKSHEYRITEKEAQMYEEFLEKLVKIGR